MNKPMKLTATHGIIAMKGSGKTYCAMRQAEQMLDAGGQVVAIDPTGAWWGLRYSRLNPSTVCYPHLLVLGANGGLPLSDSMGEAVAHLVVNQRISAVLDLSAMSKAGMRRFVAAFMLELYRINPMRPVHTFVDEADLFAPEGAQGEAANCTGAMSDYFRRGRRKGLGGTLITQRVQAIAKDVLWQCEAMTILRLKGTHDIKAIREWLDSNGFDAPTIAARLPKLEKGDRYFCADDKAEFFERISVQNQRKTYDSSRTPEPGDDAFAPPALDDDALAAIKEKLGVAAAEIDANDPKKLKEEVAKLKRELAAAKAMPAKAPAVAPHEIKDALEEGRAHGFKIGQARVCDWFREKLRELLKSTDGNVVFLGSEPQAVKPENQPFTERLKKPIAAPERSSIPSGSGPGDSSLAGGERKILTALAQYPDGRTKQQVAILTGYAHNGGGFNNYIGSLRSKGFIDGDSIGIHITEAGIRALGQWTPLPTGKALFDHWMGQLGKAEREILRAVYEEYPEARPKDYVAMKAGYQPNGGGFNNAMSRLRTLELIEGRAKVKASATLFEEVA